MKYIDEYRETFGDLWADGIQEELPDYMVEGLALYVLHGIEPGSFMSSVLSNDLMGALGRADDTNKHMLWHYGNALHNFAPGDCFGSPYLFREWCSAGGAIGKST